MDTNAGKRVLEVRKSKGMNQTDFASSLTMGQSALAMIERGQRELTEKNAKLICLTYDISYEWLMYGIGEMKPEISREEEIAAIIAKTLKSENITYQKRIIQALSNMTEKELEAFATLAESIAQKKS